MVEAKTSKTDSLPGGMPEFGQLLILVVVGNWSRVRGPGQEQPDEEIEGKLDDEVGMRGSQASSTENRTNATVEKT